MFAVKRTWLILFFLLTVSSSTVAQKKTKAQLQREKQQNLEKIAAVEKILSETAAKKKNTIGELIALNERIKEQEKLIASIKSEIRLLDTEIRENNDIIEALQDDVKKMKAEYASMLFAAQKANNSTTRLTFLFSSESFDQLVMRLRYMEQYADMRKLQADLITKVQQELSGQVKVISVQREEKNKLLADQEHESQSLSGLRKKQNSVARALEKEEKQLKKDIEETKKAVARLDNLIEEIIKEEIARTALTKSSDLVALSSSFEENKNKFPWPVTSGFISLGFGRQNHPVLKGIVLQNNGVNIQTKQNEKVKSIFQGEVRKVAFIPTFGNTIIINHGEYLTVYSGLKEVYVRMGQKVSTNQELGVIYSNGEGVSELRFQIFKNTTALDPQAWLRNM